VSGSENGIYVSKRVIFIMIFVSLFVNVFFLLMGILIGKDDLAWSTAETDPALEVARSEPLDEVEVDPIESELSVFDEETESERRDPIDPSFLDEGNDPAPAAKPAPVDPAPPPAETRRTETPKPRPEPTKPKPRPNPTNVPPTATPSASVYWIQITASKDSAKAREELTKVQAKGYRGIIIREGGFHKVRIGPYASRPSAIRDKQKLATEMSYEGWVLRKP